MIWRFISILAAANNAGQIQSRTTNPNYINYGVNGGNDGSASINNQHSAYNGPNHQHGSLFNPPNGSLSLSSLHECGKNLKAFLYSENSFVKIQQYIRNFCN